MIDSYKVKIVENCSIGIRFLQFAFFCQRKQPISKLRHFKTRGKIIDRLLELVFVYLINLYIYLINK